MTAEGIESIEQLSVARELGCDNGQGFLFSYPLPADQVLAFLDEASAHGVLPRTAFGDTIVPFRRRAG